MFNFTALSELNSIVPTKRIFTPHYLIKSSPIPEELAFIKSSLDNYKSVFLAPEHLKKQLDGTVDRKFEANWYMNPNDSVGSVFELTATGLDSNQTATFNLRARNL